MEKLNFRLRNEILKKSIGLYSLCRAADFGELRRYFWFVSETNPHFSSVFGVTPPDGACFCRIRLRLKGRVGNPPSIKCESLAEDTIQAEIDGSEAFRRTLEAVDQKAPLGERPWVLDADLQFFGSDGNAIDEPTKIEVTYFGISPKKKDKKRGRAAEPKEVAEALTALLPSIQNIAVATSREATAIANAQMEVIKQLVTELKVAHTREADRVDSAIEEMAERAKGNGSGQSPAQGSGFKTLLDLVSVAKEAKSLLN